MTVFLISILIKAFQIVLVLLVIIPLITIILAMITEIRSWNSDKNWSSFSTALFVGRVSHIRYVPVSHCFAYPLFFICLNLEESAELFLNNNSKLWPLNILMKFQESDHLKNGEGYSNDDNHLKDRIRRLCHEKTLGKYIPTKDQTILLLTHLQYFGYCFNPVSFYYILNQKNEIDAVVAEVGNTPWGEMKCYVLHPDSIDIIQVKPGTPNKSFNSINYIFHKTFHVSPFMQMDHIYDWIFWTPSDEIRVSTNMIQKETNIKFFNAYFKLKRKTLSPYSMSFQLIKFPFYCVIIQLWIHIEAFWLFYKGCEFIDHPEGSQTFASKIIGMAMTPFFQLKTLLQKNKTC